MIPDVQFEADFLRAALLLGVVREHDVRDWADALLETAMEPVALLADVALARLELTTLREALRPIAEPSRAAVLGTGLLAFLASDQAAVALPLPDRIRVLGLLRREDILAPAIAETIKTFEDRLMLALAGVSVDPDIVGDVDRWLASVRGDSYYRISLERADERAALLGALSRKVVRDRRATTSPLSGSRAWVVDSRSGTSSALMLNEPLRKIAVAEFSPLPFASRIPYAAIPAEAVLVLDEATAQPMGAHEAGACLAAI